MIRFRREIVYPLLLIGGWLCLVLLAALTDSTAVQTAFLMLLFVAVIPFSLKLRVKLAPIQKVWLVYMIICAVGCVTGPVLYHEDSEIGLSLLLFAAQFILPTLTALFCGMTDIRRPTLILYKWVMSAFSLIGVFEFVTKRQPYAFLIRSASMKYNFSFYSNISFDGYRMMLIFYHPIYYALLMSVALLCLLYVPYKNKLVNIGAMLTMILNIFLTQSRTGWLLIVLVFFGYYYAYRMKQRQSGINDSIRLDPGHAKIAALILSGTAAAAVFFLKSSATEKIRESMLRRFEAAFVDQKFGARLSNLSIIGQIAQKKGNAFYLLGGGSRYAIHYLQDNPTMKGWVRAIDNQYVTTLIDNGIVGVILLLTIFALAVRGFLKNDNKADKINDAFYLIIIMFMLSALFFDPINGNMVFYFISICFGLLKAPAGAPTALDEAAKLILPEKQKEKKLRLTI